MPKEITRINSGSEVERISMRQKLKALRNSGKRPRVAMVPSDAAPVEQARGPVLSGRGSVVARMEINL